MINTFLFSFMFSLNILSINNYLDYENYYKTKIDNPMYFFINRFDNKIFYTPKLTEFKDFPTFTFNVISKDTNYSFQTFIPGPYKDPNFHGNFSILDFIINEKYLVLLTYNAVFVFEKDSTLNYKYYDRINLEPHQQFYKLFILNNQLCIIDDKLNNMIDRTKKNIYIGKVNLNDLPLHITLDYIYNLECFELTWFQPRSIVSYDISNDRCFISDILDYKIRIFNKGILQDSILFDVPSWNDSSALVIKDKLLQLKNQNIKEPKDILAAVRENLYSTSKIRQIQYLKKDRLLVFWEGPETKENMNLHLDLWQETNGKWVMIKNDIQTPEYNEDQLVNQNNYLVTGLFDVFEDNYFVSREYDGLNRFDKKYYDMKTSEFTKLNDQAIDKDELGMSLYIFKFNFDKNDE